MKRAVLLAALVAVISVAIDFALHYGLPEQVGGATVAWRESALYFAAKFAVFWLVAFAFFALSMMEHPLGPLVYGFAASSAFGVFYYYVPQVSVGSGYMPIPLKILWGGIHWGCGTIAAGIVLRRPFSVLLGVVLLAASAAALVLVGPALTSAVPSTGY